jgi:hypothetical protein
MIAKALEPIDIAKLLGKKVINVKNKEAIQSAFVSLDGAKDLHEFKGYRFLNAAKSKTATIQVSDIVEKESGADAKAKITKKILAHNQKVL